MEKLSGSRSLNMPSDLQHGWRLIINLWHISQRNENRPCKVKQGSSSCERQCGKRPETLLIERGSAFEGLSVTPTLVFSSLLLSAIPHRWESVKTENRHFPQARYTLVSIILHCYCMFSPNITKSFGQKLQCLFELNPSNNKEKGSRGFLFWSNFNLQAILVH